MNDKPLPSSAAETEWSAVRQRCGLLDARFRGLLRMTGSDRVAFLQGMVSNDVARLAAGEGTYAALLTLQGKVVSDLRIYALADELWLDVPAGRTAAVREALERYIVADDVELTGDPDWSPLIALEGPQATRILHALGGESLGGARPYTHLTLPVDGATVRVAAVSHAGEPGLLCFGTTPLHSILWERCRAAGAEPVSMDTLDVLRLEAGVPWYGRDMDETTLIGEVGLEAAISYQKGCYLGQEVVERVSARGQVHRKLGGLLCAGKTVPPAHTALQHDGEDAGWITSAAWSPARSAVIALAYLRRDSWTPGTELQVGLPQGAVAAHVVPLPFYSTPHAPV
jgi:folate-binding protein YgfZ